MQLEELFTKALGIEDPWTIVSVEFDSIEKKLDINVDFKRGSTFDYKNPESEEIEHLSAYDTVEKTWRHQNFFQHECYIHARIPRVKPTSGGIKQISPPWSGKINGFTLLFEAFILQLCKNMPVHNAAKMLKISDHKIWAVLDRYVQMALAKALYIYLNAVGIDETSIRRGHNYISLFVDLNKKKTIFITEGKDNTTVAAFVEDLKEHGGKPEDIRDVSCDMSPAFIKGVHENLPFSEITFDKFHILKVINVGVDAVRREETKTNPILKGSRFVVLKNKENLTNNQKEKRASLSNMNLDTMKAMQMRENFQAIYQAETVEKFEEYLKQWYYWVTHSGLKPMIAAAKTIKDHWEGVVQWKRSQINNGILEGLNSIIQAAKRKARGYKFEHFRTIAFLLTGDLDLPSLNPFLPT